MLLGMIAAAMASQGVSSTPEPAEQWTEYKDETEGFSLCYPSGRLTLAKSANKSDGLQFASKDGVKLQFWSREVTVKIGLGTADTELDDELKKEGGKTHYNSKGGSIFAPWEYIEFGFGDRTYYQSMRRSGGRVLYMRLDVPNRLVDKYGPMAERLANCHKPIPPQ